MSLIRAATGDELKHFCQSLEYNPCIDIKGIVLIDDYVIRAFAAYDHWTYGSCEMHIWARGGVNRRFIREALGYPFKHGRNVIIGRTPSWNVNALEFNKRIGFRTTRKIPGAWGSFAGADLQHDLVIQELRPVDALKWFPEQPGCEEEWLQKARKEKLTRTQALNPKEISEHSLGTYSGYEVLEIPAKDVLTPAEYALVSGSVGEISSNIIASPSTSPKNES